MSALSGTFERFDVLVVPFPFTDRLTAKRRPALGVSNAGSDGRAGHAVMAMITSAEQSAWPNDVAIRDPDAAGLRSPCVVRMKLFTLDRRLVLQTAGHLSERDSTAVARSLAVILK